MNLGTDDPVVIRILVRSHRLRVHDLEKGWGKRGEDAEIVLARTRLQWLETELYRLEGDVDCHTPEAWR